MQQRQKIAKDAFFNYLSKVLPVAISIFYTFILTSQLGQEGYGIYNYLPAFLTGLFALFGGTFLNNLLWTFTARNKSKILFYKTIKVAFILGALLFVGAITFSPILFANIQITQTELLLAAGIFLLLTPLNGIYTTLFKSFSSFGKGLKASLVENIVTLVGIIIFVVIFPFGIIGAFLAKGTGLFGSLIYLIIMSKKLPLTNNTVSFNSIKKYGKWNFLMHATRELTKQIFVIVLGLTTSIVLIGQYYLIDKLTKVAVSNVSVSVQEIMLSKNSEQYSNKKRIEIQTGKAIRITFILNIILGLISLIVLPIIILLFFPTFIGSVSIIGLFLVTLVIRSQSPMSSIFDAINETKNNFKIYLLTLLLTFIILFPLAYFFSLTGYLVADIIITELQYFYTLKLLRKEGINLSVLPTKKDFNIFLEIILQSIKKFRS